MGRAGDSDIGVRALIVDRVRPARVRRLERRLVLVELQQIVCRGDQAQSGIPCSPTDASVGARSHIRSGRIHPDRRHQTRRVGAATAAAGIRPAAARTSAIQTRVHGERQRHRDPLGLVIGLLMALVSAAAINLGFLLQHRGLSEIDAARGGRWSLLRAALQSRPWLAGQALGIAAFAVQIAAIAIAPLSLVQAFAAGGLALSVPLAATLFGHRIDRVQVIAVLLIAVALFLLPIALPDTHDRLQTAPLVICATVVLAIALLAGIARLAPLLAISAGLSYGIADGAIKAISVGWGAHGASALSSGWTVLALLGTFAGFLAFQAALRVGSAVTAISLMNALAALVALACGLLAFGESLGRSPAVIAAHALAVALVLGCVPVLAAAQTEIADARERDDRQTPRDDTLPDRGDRAREGAAGGEQQRLHPRSHTRLTRPQHLTQAQVARQREGGLRGNQQQDPADHSRQQNAPPARQTDERYAGHHAGA
jgi:hypothetical protein